MNVREVLEFAKKHKVQVVDLKFVDLIGTWQHFTIPVERVDGRDVQGRVGAGRLVDPGLEGDQQQRHAGGAGSGDGVPGSVHRGADAEPDRQRGGSDHPGELRRDPRYIAQKAEKYLQSTKIGDTSYWGPEAEFFIFDQARYDQTSHSGYYFIDSDEGVWNTGKEGVNLGGKIRHKEGYFPVAPTDTQQDIRSEMILEMEKVGHRGREASS